MTDPNMNVLWSMIVELSTTLNANREATARLFRLAESVANTSTASVAATSTTNALAAVELRSKAQQFSEQTDSDGNINAPSGMLNGQVHDPSSMVAENEKLRQEIKYLRQENDDLDLLVQQYDHTIERIMEGLRVYATDHSQNILDIHKSYAVKLRSEQDRYDALHTVYSEQEQRIKALTSHLRNAYQYSCTGLPGNDAGTQEDESEPMMLYRLIYELQTENKGLRKAAGITDADLSG
ncbi:hypothetical protein V1517DRAFT_313761 [Lipomyces orientalis]|uniref:Uncharacterized protein n=1 Tax=Lipomyces orientalis TaxID=1233043 RepID=A0ACC3TWP0_9ASCO